MGSADSRLISGLKRNPSALLVGTTIATGHFAARVHFFKTAYEPFIAKLDFPAFLWYFPYLALTRGIGGHSASDPRFLQNELGFYAFGSLLYGGLATTLFWKASSPRSWRVKLGAFAIFGVACLLGLFAIFAILLLYAVSQMH